MSSNPMTSLPRQMQVWLQSLNLTYKITNPKRDLSNGWLFAEIFSRYYPEDIEMYQFDNGFKLEKKTNNWEHLNRFFKRKQVPITTEDYDPVIHCAPQSAYNLLKKVYTVLTGYQIDDSLLPIQEQLQQDAIEPDYAKATITKKMKDHEVSRIADEKRQTNYAKTIISSHNEMTKTQRMTQGYSKSKRTGFGTFGHQEASAHVLSQSKRKKHQTSTTNADLPPTGSIKPVTVKTANKTIRVMRQEANQKREPNSRFPMQDEDSDELVLENILSDIVSSTLANKLNKNDPEFRNFKEQIDKSTQYFTDRFKYIPDELILQVFQDMLNRIDEIVTVLSRNMLDICDLFSFFSECLEQVNPMIMCSGNSEDQSQSQETSTNQVNLFQKMVDAFTMIGNKLLNTDPQQTELYFLEYGIEDLINIMSNNTFKLNSMTVLLYCFVQNTNNSHFRVLTKIKEKIGIRRSDSFCAILSRLFLYEQETLSEEIYDFYLTAAARGLYATSPITRTKSITVISYLSRLRLEPILPLIPVVAKQWREDYWELKGQLLILCSNCLLQFNNPEVLENRTVDENADAVEAQSQSNNNQTENKDKPADSQAQASEQKSNIEKKSMRGDAEVTITPEVIEQFTPMIFEIIQNVLTKHAPKATIKIGLIYLAKILHLYPEYTDTYLQILLNAPENIRTAVLEIDPLPGTEEEVYAGANTEKYRTYGAPQEWNSLYIASSLEKTIVQNDLQQLEWPHIEIFEACIQIDFKPEELEQWLQIYINVKHHFLVSVCYRDFSNTTIRILKKFFFNPTMQTKVIQESLKIFIKMLGHLYKPDTEDECKENVKDFLETLHDSEDSTQDLRDFVYSAIKSFAEDKQKLYQESNLIDLMNKVVEQRRGEIFEADQHDVMSNDALSQSSALKETSSLGKNKRRAMQ